MAVVTTNLGTVTAYGDAVAAGYTGTKAQWQALMADYATVGQQAAQSAQTASTAANTATTKASEASASATAAAASAASIGTPDTTLTQSGKAADAKATGDKINSTVNSAYVTDSASGAVAHFVDGADNIPMKSVKVNIAPVQSGSGDPSPSNVRPISGWDSVKVMRAGKNLLKPPTVSTSEHNGISFAYRSDGGIVCNGTSTGVVYSATQNGFRLPVGQYVKNAQDSNGIGVIVQTKTSPNWTTVQGGGVSDRTVTINAEDTLYDLTVRIRIPSGITLNNYVYYPMLRNVDDADDTYEPYNGNTYTVSLSSAGTVYGGTLDAVSGVLTVDKGFVTLDGTQTIANRNWRATSNSVGWLYPYSVTQNVVPNSSTEVPDVISNRVKTASYSAAYNGTENNCVSFVYDTSKTYGLAVRYDNTLLTTDAAINAFLAENPIQVVYSLATPLTYQLTAQEITSLLGINNVWSDAGDVEVEYRADTKLYIKRLTGSDTDMIADTNITSGQYFMVGNDLYRATVNIASGAQIVVGTNATKVSLSEALNQIKEA